MGRADKGGVGVVVSGRHQGWESRRVCKVGGRSGHQLQRLPRRRLPGAQANIPTRGQLEVRGPLPGWAAVDELTSLCFRLSSVKLGRY